MKQYLELQKVLELIVEMQDKIEEKHEAFATKLTEVQTFVELLASLLLRDDAKTGEKMLISKCSPSLTMSKDDNNVDGGNKGGKAPRSNKGDIVSLVLLQSPLIKF